MKKSLTVRCPLCGLYRSSEIKLDHNILLKQCNKCHLISTENFDKVDFPDKEIYENNNEIKKQFLTQGKIFRQFANDLLNSLSVSKGILLDVGAGIGWLVLEAKNRGFDSEGIEISRELVSFGKKNLNINIICTPLENFQSKRKYDVIILNHILEHIQNPNQFLTKCKSLLKTKGYLAVSCPNIKSLMYLVFKARWYGLQPAQHFWQFTPQTLAGLISKNGFKIDRVIVSSLYYEPSGLKNIIFKSLTALVNLLKLGDQVTIFAQK